MNTSGDMELHDDEMFSQSKPNCIGLRECRTRQQSNRTQTRKEQICSQDMESNDDVEMFSQSQNSSQGVSSIFSELTVTQKSTNHSKSFMDLMQKTVFHHKIPYWNERETVGDGNCFYNAIIDQIENNPGVYDTLSDNAKQCSTPSELRAAVISFIASWPLVLSQQETLTIWRESGLGEGIIDWESYLHQQGKDGEYADDMVIHCTATFLAKDIYVTTQQNPSIWRHINSHAGTKGTPITLANDQSSKKDDNGQYEVGQEHFQSLIPVTKKGDSEACRNCGQQDIKRLKAHFNNSKKNCDKMYDLDLLQAEAKASLQQKRKENSARYRESNKESLRSKKAEYDRQHRAQKRQKQAEYDQQHRSLKRKSQAEYDRQHRPQKRQKQAEYYSQHRAQILQKRGEYHSQHRAQILQKKGENYSKHRAEKITAVTALRNYRSKNKDMPGRLKEFRMAQRDGLSYVCASCCRLWFKSSVVDVTSKRSKMGPEILEL